MNEDRVLFVFTPSRDDERFRRQMALIEGHGVGLADRDFTVLELPARGEGTRDGASLGESAVAQARERFGVDARDFVVVLVGYDGMEQRRYGDPVECETLFSAVDAMPMNGR